MKNSLNSLFTLLLILGIGWVVYQTTYVDPSLVRFHRQIEEHLRTNPNCGLCNKAKVINYRRELEVIEDEIGYADQ